MKILKSNNIVLYTFGCNDHRYFVKDPEGEFIDKDGTRWHETTNKDQPPASPL